MTVIEVATAEDREYAWRHAFAYADCYVSTEEATAYADHYTALIANEEELRHWPSHGPTLADWQRAGSLAP